MKVPTTWDDREGDPRGVAEVDYLRILVYVRQKLSTDWRVLVIHLDHKLVSIQYILVYGLLAISGHIYICLVGGVEHFLCFTYIGSNHPN